MTVSLLDDLNFAFVRRNGFFIISLPNMQANIQFELFYRCVENDFANKTLHAPPF